MKKVKLFETSRSGDRKRTRDPAHLRHFRRSRMRVAKHFRGACDEKVLRSTHQYIKIKPLYFYSGFIFYENISFRKLFTFSKKLKRISTFGANDSAKKLIVKPVAETFPFTLVVHELCRAEVE
jgi:hypothetical protein